MNLIFVGPQGSGKGTQAKRIAKRFGICHISSGDALREVVDGRLQVADGLAKEIRGCMERGELVSDVLIFRILKEKLFQEDCDNGFILDGFPRNVSQAEELKKISDIDKVVEIFISDDEAVRRVCGRRNCSKCGAIYNVSSSPKPKIEGVCDKCGGELFARKDDNEDALKERLRVYHEETEGILKMYDSIRVDGERSIEEVFENIVEILS